MDTHVYSVADLNELRAMFGHDTAERAKRAGAPDTVLVRGVSGEVFVYVLADDASGVAGYEPWTTGEGSPRGFADADSAAWAWSARGREVWAFVVKGDVRNYLPANASGFCDGSYTAVTGYDSAGWTLEDYVLPRLASGGHFPIAPAYRMTWPV